MLGNRRDYYVVVVNIDSALIVHFEVRYCSWSQGMSNGGFLPAFASFPSCPSF